MLKLNDLDLKRHSDLFFREASKGGKAALMFDDFIKTTLTSLYSQAVFPEEIRLCRPLEEMIKGDFSPSEVIRMPSPEINGIPVWRGCTKKDEGVVLRGAGYANGDSRKPCNIALDDKVPHGLLAGATGHGKSVTLNSIINTACLEYPPWYVQFILVDAKIVEMKAYGIGSIIPHISSIAATSDAEFIISVLEDTYSTMMLRNSVFTKAGTKNITSFMKKTNLCLPHIMITIDEFQTMFMNAARKAKFISELISKVARLGRNTGVHLLLASQELGSDIDKSVLGNIGTRLCLGCMPSTSIQVLGNDAAKTNYNERGRLIINNNPAKDNNVDENVSLRTPYLPDIKVEENLTLFDYMRELESIGKKAKPSPFYNLSFYDEEEKCYESKFPQVIDGKSKPNMLYLGEPSFVLRNDDGEKWLRIELKEDVAQNILIYSPMARNRERYLRMLSYNILDMRKQGIDVQCITFYSNKESFSRINMGLAKKNVYIRDFSSSMESGINSAFYRRVLVECDERAFEEVKLDNTDMELFENTINKENQFPGELWKKRAQVLMDLYRNQYGSKIGIDAVSNAEKKTSILISHVSAMLNQFKSMKVEVRKLTQNDLKPQFIIISGLEQIGTLGVDSKNKRVEDFKKIINESPEFKVFFIVSTQTMEDCAILRTAFTHVLCDNLNSSMQGHLKIADYYPDQASPALGIYYLSTAEENRCRKFKKMIYEGEIL